ncbi:hypothetical protein [Burkholderia stabilis]|uniref:hypothetical protein n=1 Tax=Burkholderia stabilis TaxID=95485 RepID=UPI0012E9C268|nr:hypothetical protein [Burkholderia stabilis]HDR9490134.1 hypothetical protein [Burkholderia stabilis]HDR9521688.1 hypothetical protein [Burkholderia stabilis]HDR9537239.1 hypothetical protein [Burkholderia stabilis]HDR9575185.1 hypothetical protein [Burkholderia stabilis]HDR9624360.1 hypothetical protein [Burkholderia stabilis]
MEDQNFLEKAQSRIDNENAFPFREHSTRAFRSEFIGKRRTPTAAKFFCHDGKAFSQSDET